MGLLLFESPYNEHYRFYFFNKLYIFTLVLLKQNLTNQIICFVHFVFMLF